MLVEYESFLSVARCWTLKMSSRDRNRGSRHKRSDPKPILCQVAGCTVNLRTCDRSYFIQKRICPEHSQEPELIKRNCDDPDLRWRFCFKCSKLEPVSQFDGLRRNCRASLEKRKMLAEAAAAVAATSPRGARDISLQAAVASPLHRSADEFSADKTMTPSPTGTYPTSNSMSDNANSGPASPSSHPPVSCAEACMPHALPGATRLHNQPPPVVSALLWQHTASSSAPAEQGALASLPYGSQATTSAGAAAAVVSAAPAWHQGQQLLQGQQQEQQQQLPTAFSGQGWPSSTAVSAAMAAAAAAAAVEIMQAPPTVQELLPAAVALTGAGRAAGAGAALDLDAVRSQQHMLSPLQQQLLQAESDYAVFLDELLQLSAEVANPRQLPTSHLMLRDSAVSQQAASSSHGHQEPPQRQRQQTPPVFAGAAATAAMLTYPAEHGLPETSTALALPAPPQSEAAAAPAASNGNSAAVNRNLQLQVQRIQQELQKLNRQCEMVSIVVEQIQANLNSVQQQVLSLNQIMSG